MMSPDARIHIFLTNLWSSVVQRTASVSTSVNFSSLVAVVGNGSIRAAVFILGGGGGGEKKKRALNAIWPAE